MRIALMAVATAVFLAACGTTPEPKPTAPAGAKHRQAGRRQPGVRVRQPGQRQGDVVPMADGVHVTGTVGGLPPNSTHGFHVHEKGDCSAADATSAGGHFNPVRRTAWQAPTARTMPATCDNVVADAEGVANLDVARQRRDPGRWRGQRHRRPRAGRACGARRLHQPAPGNAGARVACGVIKVTQ